MQRINETLVRRIEELTGQDAHHLIKRGFFFSHRDLDKVLDAYEMSVRPSVRLSVFLSV